MRDGHRNVRRVLLPAVIGVVCQSLDRDHEATERLYTREGRKFRPVDTATFKGTDTTAVALSSGKRNSQQCRRIANTQLKLLPIELPVLQIIYAKPENRSTFVLYF